MTLQFKVKMKLILPQNSLNLLHQDMIVCNLLTEGREFLSQLLLLMTRSVSGEDAEKVY